MFSFHATKVFHTVEGGALTYKDSAFIVPLEATKNFGIATNGEILYTGGNAKMNEFQAVIGLANLSKIHKYIKRRKVISLEYSKHFKDVEGLEIYEPDKEVESNYSYYPILITKSDKNPSELIDFLSEFNISARRYFYPLTSDFPAYNKQYDSNKTPVAKYVSERVLCLPIYDSLRMNDVKRVILKVKEYMQT
jgi:dTDP-4-amino-4,6-dideoxygalactose transaminase